jgi:hypothetical protein
MIVLNNKCEKCNKICYAIYFQQNFINWTSGDDDIDKFIQDSQLSVHIKCKISEVLEWIPYDRFYNIEYITKAEMYKANWIDGKISYWSYYDQNWMRENQNMIVELESIDILKNITLEFIDEVLLIFCFIKNLKFLIFNNLIIFVD